MDAADGNAVIDLLLEEYRSLRQEIIQKQASQSSLLGFGATGIGLAFGLTGSLGKALLAASLITLLGVYYHLITARNVALLSRHVAGLEERINTLARSEHPASEDVLTWETRLQSRPASIMSPWFRLIRKSIAATEQKPPRASGQLTNRRFRVAHGQGRYKAAGVASTDIHSAATSPF
jgi:hypothetical protein